MSIFLNIFLGFFLTISCLALNAESRKKEVVDSVSVVGAVEKTQEGIREAEAIVSKVEEKEVDGSLYVLNCSECHGFDGNSPDQVKPNLAGLNEKYLIRQLNAFKTGGRIDKDMKRVVNEIPLNGELEGLAKYFSLQKMINKNTPETIKNHQLVDVNLGKEIFTGKRIDYGIPACAACHGKDGMGDKEGKYPRLAGQNMDYIIKQMELFRSKDRSNDVPPQMRGIAGQMDDEDIASVAAYIAYMTVD